MRVPPPTFDGARVLWWAWAGEKPGAQDDDRLVFGFAVGRYGTGSRYRFTCNRHWQVVQDLDHSDEGEAVADIPAQYDVSRVTWQRYDA